MRTLNPKQGKKKLSISANRLQHGVIRSLVVMVKQPACKE